MESLGDGTRAVRQCATSMLRKKLSRVHFPKISKKTQTLILLGMMQGLICLPDGTVNQLLLPKIAKVLTAGAAADAKSEGMGPPTPLTQNDFLVGWKTSMGGLVSVIGSHLYGELVEARQNLRESDRNDEDGNDHASTEAEAHRQDLQRQIQLLRKVSITTAVISVALIFLGLEAGWEEGNLDKVLVSYWLNNWLCGAVQGFMAPLIGTITKELFSIPPSLPGSVASTSRVSSDTTSCLLESDREESAGRAVAGEADQTEDLDVVNMMVDADDHDDLVGNDVNDPASSASQEAAMSEEQAQAAALAKLPLFTNAIPGLGQYVAACGSPDSWIKNVVLANVFIVTTALALGGGSLCHGAFRSGRQSENSTNTPASVSSYEKDIKANTYTPATTAACSSPAAGSSPGTCFGSQTFLFGGPEEELCGADFGSESSAEWRGRGQETTNQRRTMSTKFRTTDACSTASAGKSNAAEDTEVDHDLAATLVADVGDEVHEHLRRGQINEEEEPHSSASKSKDRKQQILLLTQWMMCSLGTSAQSNLAPNTASHLCHKGAGLPKDLTAFLVTMGPLFGAVLAASVVQPWLFRLLERNKGDGPTKPAHTEEGQDAATSDGCPAAMQRGRTPDSEGQEELDAAMSSSAAPTADSATTRSATTSRKAASLLKSTARRVRKCMKRDGVVMRAGPQLAMFCAVQTFYTVLPQILVKKTDDPRQNQRLQGLFSSEQDQRDLQPRISPAAMRFLAASRNDRKRNSGAVAGRGDSSGESETSSAGAKSVEHKSPRLQRLPPLGITSTILQGRSFGAVPHDSRSSREGLSMKSAMNENDDRGQAFSTDRKKLGTTNESDTTLGSNTSGGAQEDDEFLTSFLDDADVFQVTELLNSLKNDHEGDDQHREKHHYNPRALLEKAFNSPPTTTALVLLLLMQATMGGVQVLASSSTQQKLHSLATFNIIDEAMNYVVGPLIANQVISLFQMAQQEVPAEDEDLSSGSAPTTYGGNTGTGSGGSKASASGATKISSEDGPTTTTAAPPMSKAATKAAAKKNAHAVQLATESTLRSLSCFYVAAAALNIGWEVAMNSGRNKPRRTRTRRRGHSNCQHLDRNHSSGTTTSSGGSSSAVGEK
ncbi:unnamed protein product [Amoebophrya sp. A120]|nr:unnamed protein product [Amoebophrya sp. A120]|eukprot:GSA120T00018793001.1